MNLHEQLSASSMEAFKLFSLTNLGAKAAFSEEVDANDLGHFFEVLSQRLEALHDELHALQYSDLVKHADSLSKAGAK